MDTINNILIIKHGSLGDIVQISGALKDLREKISYLRKWKEALSDGKKNNLKIPKWVLE